MDMEINITAVSLRNIVPDPLKAPFSDRLFPL